jgi:hypothetical protein
MSGKQVFLFLVISLNLVIFMFTAAILGFNYYLIKDRDYYKSKYNNEKLENSKIKDRIAELMYNY